MSDWFVSYYLHGWEEVCSECRAPGDKLVEEMAARWAHAHCGECGRAIQANGSGAPIGDRISSRN